MTLSGPVASTGAVDPMAHVYSYSFWTLAAVTSLLAWTARPKDGELSPAAAKMARTYLPIWYICVMGDWLQGPYVYALYDAYGFPRSEIAQLFVAGFGASMAFGTFVGAWGDQIGRRSACQLYCLLYIISCATKHFNDYNVLMAGRITGGIATSLLFSSFESWLVCEHVERRGLSQSALGHIFAWMWFGNSLVAILAGQLGDLSMTLAPLTRWEKVPMFYYGGFTAPFDLAIVLLLIGLVLLTFCWTENYGASEEGGEQSSMPQTFAKGLLAVGRCRRMLVVMIAIACFEGSMYTFVFNWTPALQNKFSTPAFGTVFSCFMMAFMCGSCIFDLISSHFRNAAARVLQGTLCFAAVAFLIPAGAFMRMETSVSQMTLIFVGFCAFEFCVGLYFPSISTLKSQVVPDQLRSTIYNIYRIPMNAVVLAVLLNNIGIVETFKICLALLSLATVIALLGWPAEADTKTPLPNHTAEADAERQPIQAKKN